MEGQLCKPDDLKERAARGDPELLQDLFSCYRSDLTAFLRRRCGDATDADDAVQDAFVAAARYLATYRGETPLKNWLYRLASSACTRMRRGRKNDPRLHLEYDEPITPALHSMGEAVERMLEARLTPVRSALESLGDVDRAVLLLRDGQGMSAREVGGALELSESAVKSRLHRARKSVRDFLAE